MWVCKELELWFNTHSWPWCWCWPEGCRGCWTHHTGRRRCPLLWRCGSPQCHPAPVCCFLGRLTATHTHKHNMKVNFTRAATTNMRLSRLNTCKFPAWQIWRHGWKIITVSTLTTFVMGTSRITDNKLKRRLHCVNTLQACCVANRPVFLSISGKLQGPIFYFFRQSCL